MTLPTTAIRDRILGALYGLAYGDAVGFPSLFHRFHVLPAKRHDFLFTTNMRQSRQHILPLALPFTHRQAESTLSPKPTDDTEYCVFALEALLSDEREPAQKGEPAQERKPAHQGGQARESNPTLQSILAFWINRLVDTEETIWTRFSERAAIENLRRGLKPPESGNDNPLHYEDAAVSRAIAIGLFFPGSPDKAAELAGVEASISQSEDGIWGAQAMAAAIAALIGGDEPAEAVEQAVSFFPPESWIAAEMEKARAAADRADRTHELALFLAEDVINNLYSFGNAAPETVPAALTLFADCPEDLLKAVASANLIAKSADSLPAMVGALCGAAGAGNQIGKAWQERLDVCHGICLPWTNGVRLSELADRLVRRQQGTTDLSGRNDGSRTNQ